MAAAKRETRQDGFGEKQTVRVMTVDRTRNRVECATRDGAMIYAAIWETPTVFRWPEPGETWTVRKDTGIWRMDQIVQTELAELESEATPITLRNLPEGDARIIGETVHVNTLNVSKLEGIQEFVPSVRAYNSTGQVFPTGSLIPLNFDSERYDNAGMHSAALPTRLVAPLAGVYVIVSNLSWTYAGGSTERFLDILVNGTNQIASQRLMASPSGTAEMSTQTTQFLNVGDYVETRGYQTSGGNLATTAANLAAPQEFSMVYLGNNLPRILPRPDTAAAGHDWGLVTSLPTEAQFGDYCTFKVGTGIFWRLMYSGEETYPWAKIGGPPITSQIGPLLQTESEVPQSTGAPFITIPLKCIANTTYGSTRAVCGAGSYTQISLYSNGVLQTEPSYAGTSIQTNPSSLFVNMALPINASVQVRYNRLGGSGLAQFIGMFLSIDPLRVG